LETSLWVERNRQKNADGKVAQKKNISRKKKLATFGTLSYFKFHIEFSVKYCKE